MGLKTRLYFSDRTLILFFYTRDHAAVPQGGACPAVTASFLFQDFVSTVERLFPHVTLVLPGHHWPPVIPAMVGSLSQRVALHLKATAVLTGPESMDTLMGLMDSFDLLVEDTETGAGASVAMEGLVSRRAVGAKTNIYVMFHQYGRAGSGQTSAAGYKIHL